MLALSVMAVLKLSLPVVALLVARPVARAWRRVGAAPPLLRGDKLVLRHCRFYRWLMLGIAAGSFAFAVRLFQLAMDPSGAIPIAFAVVLFVLAVGLVGLGVFVVATLRVRLEFDQVGLRGRTMWRGWRTVGWGEIARIRYSATTKDLTITDAAGERVVGSALMPGFHTLLAQLRTRVPREIHEPAVSMAAVDPLAPGG